jgi:hypothetical protein
MPERAAKTPTLGDVLIGLPKQLKEDKDLDAILARMLVVLIARQLIKVPYRKQAGMGLLYQRVFGQSFSTLLTAMRRSRSEATREFRRMLRIGPGDYLSSAMREIGERLV